MEKISREKFIRLGSALGVGAAAASLVACGGGSGGSSGGSSNGGSGGSGEKEKAGSSQASKEAKGSGGSKENKQAESSSAGEEAKGGGSGEKERAEKKEKPESPQAGGEAQGGGAAIAQESQVAPNSDFKFKEGGQPAVLVHLQSGDFVAYSAVCTHQGCTVAYNNAQLVCPCHGSVFDPANGAAVVTGPATTPLPEIPVTVEGGQVLRA